MEKENTVLELDTSDLLDYTVEQVTCTNCIEGLCPARTPSTCDGVEFILCGAKKDSQPVLAAYTERTGIELHIERPC